MPSPVGHALAGVAAGALLAGAATPLREWWRGPLRAWPPFVFFAALAVAPDLDLLAGTHSTYTHSLGAALIAGLLGFACARERRWTVAAACAAAYASHILLDWLGDDGTVPIGIMALWPISDRFYESDRHWFIAVSRHYHPFGEFLRYNLRALAWEIVVLGPITAGIWWARRRP